MEQIGHQTQEVVDGQAAKQAREATAGGGGPVF